MKKRIFIIIGVLIILTFLAISLLLLSIKFELKGKNEIELLYNTEYKENGVSLKILNKDLSNKVTIKGKVNTKEVGNYEIEYLFKLGLLNFSKKRTVKVVDREKPILTLIGDEEKIICPNTTYKEEGYEAIDDYDGILTDKVIVKEKENEIEYKVQDTYGNTTIKTRTIKKIDEEKPKITLKGGSTVYVKINNEYKEYGYTITDNCDDLTDKVVINKNVDTSKLGEYYVTYSVTDNAGNKSEVKRKVVVTNNKSVSNPAEHGVIYLTFDDGPGGASTNKILDVLKDEGVKATFFVTGNGSPSLIKREFDEGHQVALHTYTHNYQKVYNSVDGYFNDLEKIQDLVEKTTGYKSYITRFPGGSNNTVNRHYNNYNGGIMYILREEVMNRGYVYFDWNVDSNDAGTCAKSGVRDRKTCVYNNVTKNLSKSRSNVVLMHDIKSYTADAIRDIIRYGKENGYEFDIITMDTYQVKFN